MAVANNRTAGTPPQTALSGDRSVRAPVVLLISLAGIAGLVALAAAWLWVTRGPAILLDIAQVFCF